MADNPIPPETSAAEGVVDNTARQRFELTEQGLTAFADYRLQGGRLVLPHVEAPVALRGTGAAGRLMTGVLEIARARGLKVVPHCPYAAVFIQRHPQYQDLVA
ncbi:MAG: GNAT family N-acetyltransferase [Caulobacteraceae bacterium]